MAIPARITIATLGVSDLARSTEFYRLLGWELANAEWGGVSGYFADPDGYPWEVAWGPNSKFKPDGSLDMG